MTNLRPFPRLSLIMQCSPLLWLLSMNITSSTLYGYHSTNDARIISTQQRSKRVFAILQNSPCTLPSSAILSIFSPYREMNNPIARFPFSLPPRAFFIFDTFNFVRIRIQFILRDSKKVFVPFAKFIIFLEKYSHDVLFTLRWGMTSSPHCIEERSRPIGVAKEHNSSIEFKAAKLSHFRRRGWEKGSITSLVSR